MSAAFSSSRRPGGLRSRLALVGVSAVVVLATASPGSTGGPVAATAADDLACPAAFPVAELSEGLAVTGLTVSHGTDPDLLTGEVVGVIPDGIAPGHDMVVARLAGSEVTDPGTGAVWRGIWAGMSGSPVYAPDGRLVGAVSYRFTLSPSDYAGITPAADLYSLRDHATARAATPRTVAVPTRLASAMAGDGATAADLASGFHPLRVPIVVSGIGQGRLERLARRLDHPLGRLVAGPGAAVDEPGVPIEPGGNLTASLSYGDLSQTATGTATAVCDGQVLGFGHPVAFTGPSTMTMHGARALFIESDVLDGSFKAAVPTAPVGQITQDRLSGILGVPGPPAPGTEITSHLRGMTGDWLDGSTTSTAYLEAPPNVPWVVASHLYSGELAAFDKDFGGTADTTWTVEVTTDDGAHLAYTWRTVATSHGSLPMRSADMLYMELWGVLQNRFDRVHVDRVAVSGRLLDEAWHSYRVQRVERRDGGQWVAMSPGSGVSVEPGATLPLRVRIVPRRGRDAVSLGEPTWVRLAVPVAARLAGKSGRLVVSGGATTRSLVSSEPGSLAELFDHLGSRPASDRVLATLQVGNGAGEVTRRVGVDTPSHTRGQQEFMVHVSR